MVVRHLFASALLSVGLATRAGTQTYGWPHPRTSRAEESPYRHLKEEWWTCDQVQNHWDLLAELVGLNEIYDVEVGPDDRVSLLTRGGRVAVVTSSGETISDWHSFTSENDDVDLAVASSGIHYVADGYWEVEMWSPDGVQLGLFGEDDYDQSSADGEFTYPTGVAVSSAGRVFVVDSGNYRIQEFSEGGQYVSQWSRPEWSELRAPRKIAITNHDEIVVLAGNDWVEQYGLDGAPLAAWQLPPMSGGYAPRGSDVEVDEARHVYVSDPPNGRILEFDGDGGFLGEWSRPVWSAVACGDWLR